MASSAGFSIASSPPEVISGMSSPQKSGRQTPARKAPSAAQLLEQIRHLEAEGKKLRAETAGGVNLFSSITEFLILMKQDQTCLYWHI